MDWRTRKCAQRKSGRGKETAAEIERPEDKDSARVARECMEKT